MKRFLQKLTGKKPVMGTVDATIATGLSETEIDAAATHSGAVPLYPLGQVIKNQLLKESDAAAPNSGTSSAPHPFSSTEAPATSSRYRQIELIGEGGTALIYQAYDETLQRPIALKRFKESAENADYLGELQSASHVHHPNVVSVYDAGVNADGAFIVMELIEGEDLERSGLERRYFDNLHRFRNQAIQLLEGLDAVHAGGLLHLDLKPSNIMVCDQASGRSLAKIVDFGRASLQSKDGKAPVGKGLDGSIYYSAPEQLLSQPLDVRTDLYSLGCVFYFLLSGRRPFQGDHTLQVMTAHLQHSVVDLSEVAETLPRWLCDWVMRLIAQEPGDRYGSALDALAAFNEGSW